MPRVLIADDNPMIRQSLATVIVDYQGWEVCGEATNGRRSTSPLPDCKQTVRRPRLCVRLDKLVFDRLLYVIDYDSLDNTCRVINFQPKLVLKSFQECWTSFCFR